LAITEHASNEKGPNGSTRWSIAKLLPHSVAIMKRQSIVRKVASTNSLGDAQHPSKRSCRCGVMIQGNNVGLSIFGNSSICLRTIAKESLPVLPFLRLSSSNRRSSSRSLTRRKASRHSPTCSPPFVWTRNLSRTPKTPSSKGVTEQRCNMKRNRIHKHPSHRPLYHAGLRRSNHSGLVSPFQKTVVRQPMSILDLHRDRHAVYSSETASGEWCGWTL
jgi:hypothetical protein